MLPRLARLFRAARSTAPTPPTRIEPRLPKGHLGLEDLEGRDVPSSVSLAFSADGSKYDLLAVSSTGVLYRYTPGQTASNFTPLAGNVRSASATYDPSGNEEIDVVYTNGSLVAYGANVPGGQQTVIPSTFGVASESVSYAGPSRLRFIVLENGLTFSQDANGNYTQLSLNGVQSITALYSTSALIVSDYLYTNGVLEIDGGPLPPAFATLILGNLGNGTLDGPYEAASIALPLGHRLLATIPLDPSGAEIVQVGIPFESPVSLGSIV